MAKKRSKRKPTIAPVPCPDCKTPSMLNADGTFPGHRYWLKGELVVCKPNVTAKDRGEDPAA